MKDLLICIAHHHAPDRLQYLLRVLKAFREYNVSHDIIVDTNGDEVNVLGDNLTTFRYPKLDHPFHLAWMHRKHFKDQINNYANFMYVEDDVMVPYFAYLHCVKAFTLLWPTYVPSFIRIENDDNDNYVLDVTERQVCDPIRIGGRLFATLNQPYHGFWIMPQYELKQSMTPDFARLSDSRENAAAYPMWELHKTPVVEIWHINGRWQIKPECFAYHLPNNYTRCKGSPFAKIKVKEVFFFRGGTVGNGISG